MSVRKKLVLVGNDDVGLNALLRVFCGGAFIDAFAGVYDMYTADIEFDSTRVSLEIPNMAGQEHYDRLRPQYYPGADAFVICFSISSPASLVNVKAKWKPEIESLCPDVPILLVGTKKDLRDETRGSDETVATTQGRRTAEQIGAVAYLECSALSNEGVRDVFVAATKAALRGKKQKRSCSVQ